MAFADILITKLRAAAHAYYETATPMMTDTEYDALVEQLTAAAPDHPFLKEIGSAPGSAVVVLPVPMPSLDKRKPGTLKAADLAGSFMVSEKLDGISALWVSGYNGKPALYLRGNGIDGQDISHCIKGIHGLKSCVMPIAMVRGELIVPKGILDASSAPRNWVNGVLHQITPSLEDLSKIHFVAYQVCYPKTLTRQQQNTWMNEKGFEVAWSRHMPTLDGAILQTMFKDRRDNSTYECDGIVVGASDTIPTLAPSNPKDAYAFKMPVDDQRATTQVVEVEWNSSRTGNWVPRIRFEPVKIGSASIECCTGFNAQFIKENCIGPGATIIVRRSGDVIPVCERVVKAATNGWQQPPAGCWSWDATETHALDTSEEVTPEKLALELAHQIVALGVEGCSKTTTKKLVDGGIGDLTALVKVSAGRLQELIGKVNGQKLFDATKTCVTSATLPQWLYAYLGWPKGFGRTRIASTLAVESDVSKWPTMKAPPKGQSADAFSEVTKCVPAYITWREQFGATATPATPAVVAAAPTIASKGSYVMSGFRDATLTERLAVAGWKMADKVNKTTTFLLIPDDAKETVKVKAARDAGLRIVMRSQVDGLF